MVPIGYSAVGAHRVDRCLVSALVAGVMCHTFAGILTCFEFRV